MIKERSIEESSFTDQSALKLFAIMQNSSKVGIGLVLVVLCGFSEVFKDRVAGLIALEDSRVFRDRTAFITLIVIVSSPDHTFKLIPFIDRRYICGSNYTIPGLSFNGKAKKREDFAEPFEEKKALKNP